MKGTVENNNPLKISCKFCGAPANFDIIRQTYCCAYCGQITQTHEVNSEKRNWRRLHKDRMKEEFAGQSLEEYSCPSCGAKVVFQAGEAAESCDFCKTKLIRKDLTSPEQMPDVIIPFYITPTEARKRMLDWGHANGKTKEGKTLVSNMDKFQGYYLPYQIVQGPVYGQVSREGSYRRFQCAGYLQETVVNTSKQLSNFVLNGMEPFDWSGARPFEYGYIAGNKVKLRDISDAETEKRVLEETEQDFLPEIEKVMQTGGVGVNIGAGSLSVISALLPVYFIKSGSFLAAMNGQTGKISVSANREKVSFPWIIEPIVLSLLMTLILGFLFQFDFGIMFIGGITTALPIFAIYSEGRYSLVRRILSTSRNSKAIRQGKEIMFQEGKDILRPSFENKPVFQELNNNGIMVPVKIKFYGLSRIVSIFINMILLIFLPVFAAALIRLGMISGTNQDFFRKFNIVGGAAWYSLAFFVAIIYWVKGVRQDAYEHPVIYEILANGKTKKIKRKDSGKIRLLSVFGIGLEDATGKKIGIIRFLSELGGIGVFLGVFVVLLLFGSILAIVH